MSFSLNVIKGPFDLVNCPPFVFRDFKDVDLFLREKFLEYQSDYFTFDIAISLVGSDIFKDRIDVYQEDVDSEDQYFLNKLIQMYDSWKNSWMTPESHKLYFVESVAFLKSHL